jgi:hypothetical protein
MYPVTDRWLADRCKSSIVNLLCTFAKNVNVQSTEYSTGYTTDSPGSSAGGIVRFPIVPESQMFPRVVFDFRSTGGPTDRWLADRCKSSIVNLLCTFAKNVNVQSTARPPTTDSPGSSAGGIVRFPIVPESQMFPRVVFDFRSPPAEDPGESVVGGRGTH